jgi:serine/threonine protein kinase/tetratricopeptide (TPR) repeat protein
MNRLREIFDGAIEKSGIERRAFLDGACVGEPGLRAQIESLIAAGEERDAFLSSPTSDSGPGSDAATVDSPLPEGPGTRIGLYKILQLIGEGGFGSVFMAEQEQPVSRKVALKIIKLGMDTKAVIARFEAERQALAIMDHPNIARVLDAGATDTGRPFFVMELVKGDPVVEYCDKNNLSIEDRLELFAQVCNAVQHAHTKGIIHRDIKPSNILVSTQDGQPHAKVIDFGIAKATASKLTEKTLFTEHRQLIGTPEYMSPEQAEGSLDIDTRTDVYSLGVLLYELLTGTTPFNPKELRSAAYAEIQRIIREVEPPKPSTRISHNTGTIASVAAKRHTEPKRLGTIVRGELDWIVMKALEKDRQRRYETANGLAMDIRRYLAGEAVVAAPPSTAYRFKKFIRRNRVMVTAGGAVAAALLIGLIAFGWQAKVARDQRDRAVQAQSAEAEQRKQADAARTEAQKQEAEARKQAAIAEAVARFQTDMLAAADPLRLQGDKVTVVQVMEAAVRQLDNGSLKDQPLVEAGVRNAIGGTMERLARFDDAESNMRRALELRRQALAAGHRDIAVSQNNLALLLFSRNRVAEAEPLFREALQVFRVALPAGHREIANTTNNLAALLEARNKLAEAEPLFREALAMRRTALPAGHPEIALSLNDLALFLTRQNRLAEAEPLHREALAIWRAALPPGHPDLAMGLNNLGLLLKAQGKLAEAEPLYREAVKIDQAALPAGHPTYAIDLNNLASLLQDQNKLSEAEPLFRQALEIDRAALPAGHPEIAAVLDNLAKLLQVQGKLTEAETHQREALQIRRAAFPAGHPQIAQSLYNLAFLLRDQNRLTEAEPLYREALEIYRAALPAGHPDIAGSLNGLATLLLLQNKLAEAEPLYREALTIRRAAFPAGHPQIATVLNNLARVQQGLGHTAEARAAWDEAIAMLRQGSPNGSANFARVLWRSGSARLENKDAAAALPELEEAAAMAEKLLKPEDPQLKEYRETLATCKAALTEPGKASGK